MKHINTYLLVLLWIASIASSNKLFAQHEKSCASDEMLKQRLIAHPEYLQRMQALENYTSAYIQHMGGAQPEVVPPYIIPVVFHILHNYGPENISDAQVRDAIRIMNEDFRKLNTDIADVMSAFVAIEADCEIEFRLATIDPNGNCTNGIDRIATMATYVGGDDSKLNDWPNNKYLNIWVTYEVGVSGAAAYSQYPGSGADETDGVLCSYGYVGSIGTSNQQRAHVLTHEVGHYLNLQHPWGSTNSPGVACGDDAVSDTPETMGWTHCQLTNTDVCNPGSPENVQNFMDYAYCDRMFTLGQKTRMTAAITSSIQYRNQLWSPSNLTATGALVSPAPNCAPRADFTANYTTVCKGSNVTYTDLSWNGNPTSWNWTFTGGTPASSTDSMPVITYNSPGTYPVTITASNAAGNSNKTKTSYITVLDTALKYATPVLESFEASAYPNSDWSIINPDASTGGVTWTKTTSARVSGNASIKINNFVGGVAGQTETLISPLYDFTTASSRLFTFKLAYAPASSTSTDELRVAFSLDCGATWQYRYDKLSADLSTAGIKTSSFTPTIASQWRTETINIQAYIHKTNVRVKFEFISGGDGNNIYIDDICLNWISGVEENSAAEFGAAIYPNPFLNETQIRFYLPEACHVQYSVSNVLGEKILSSTSKLLEPGPQSIPLAIDASPGIYFIRVEMNEKFFVLKAVAGK